MILIDDYKINNSSYTRGNMYSTDKTRLNTAKNTNYIKKCLKRKLRRINFPKKISLDTYLYVPQEWS